MAQVRAVDRLRRLLASDVVDLYAPDADGEPFTLEVPIRDGLVTLDLSRHSVRSATFEVKVQIADGSYATVGPDALRTFRGTVREIKGATVAGSLLADGLRAMIALPEGDTYFVEPVDPGRATVGTVGRYVVYRGEDVAPDGRTCGVIDGEPGADEEPTRDRSLLGPGPCGGEFCVAQLACDTDVEFYQAHGSSTDTATSYIECLVNIMNVVFERDVEIRHLITTVIIRTAEPDPYSSTDSLTLLNQMQAYWNANLGSVTRDTAHLFTGKNMGTVVGRAFLGHVCDLPSAYGLSNADNFALLSCDSDTVTHEIGHNWNADHCACASPPYTMNPDIICALRFHPTLSIPPIVTHRNSRTCLGTAPVNDAAGAAVGVCSGTYFGSTAAATNDGSASCGNSTSSPDVWYVYKAATTGTVSIDTCSSTFDTVLSVHTAFPGTIGSEIACSDDSDACSFGSQQSSLTFSAAAQHSYWIRVSGFNGATGGFTLHVSGTCGAPFNDSALNALAICSGAYYGTTVGATSDGSSSCDSPTPSGDVWFSYTPQGATPLVIDTCDSAFDTVLSVHTGRPGTAANQVVCNDDFCGTQSKIEMTPVTGTTYYIRVAGFNGASGPFKLALSGAECAADWCQMATEIGDGRYFGTLVGVAADGYATCGSSVQSPDIFYRYTAPITGMLRVDTCGTSDAGNVDAGIDTVVSLHWPCPVPADYHELACSDDTSTCGGGDEGVLRDSAIDLPVTAGQVLIIRVSRFGATRPGPYVLNVHDVPTNDACANAMLVGLGQTLDSLAGATADGSSTCGGDGLPDLWYRFVGTCTGTLHVNTCGTMQRSSMDTILSVHAGCPGTTANEVTCNDDAVDGDDPAICGDPNTTDSAVAVPVAAGQSLFIRVARYPLSPAGALTLNLTCNSAPDTPGPPNGPTRGYEGVGVGFSASTFDPEVDLITYTFDWGDSTTSQSSPIPSGGQVTLSHAYANEGVYGVTVRATDSHGHASPFSLPSFVNIADADCRMGNVDLDNGGPPVDVLFVNGSAGLGPARFFVASRAAPLEVSLNPAPAGPMAAQARYAVWVWRSYPTSSTDVDAPYGIGRMCMNPLITTCGDKCASFAAKNIGGYCGSVLCSTAQATGAWPPGVVMRIPAGTLNSGETIFVQGVIRDQSDTGGRHFSATNGVEVMIVQ
ncbi:MAG: hypothetical protein HY292_17065 [Planctomycetes bacterium]|nr:hypothetical protein [Planctomycetota bacterium]